MTKVEQLCLAVLKGVSSNNPKKAVALIQGLIAAAREDGAEQEAAKIVHCGECRYAEWETQEPFGKGKGIACHVIAGRSRPWLGAATDYCSEGRRKEEKP